MLQMKILSKLFSIGNTFCQAMMQAHIFCICCAMTWIRPMVKSRPNMKKGNNIEISDGVSVLLVIYW